MPLDLSGRIVIAVTCSSLFDMSEEDAVFREKGELEYRKFQRDKIDIPLKRGGAFPFIKNILSVNRLLESKMVEVVVLSRNDPFSGDRFFRSCAHYSMDITRGAFLSGRPPYEYISSFEASLFLSRHEEDVKAAIAADQPAGLILGNKDHKIENEDQLRIAFDFDGIVASDDSEAIYRELGLPEFKSHETVNKDIDLSRGPLNKFFSQLSMLSQKLKGLSIGRDILRIAIITARDAPAHTRLLKTLEAWDIQIDEIFYMGGVNKANILKVFNPHIFFDDQIAHIDSTKDVSPSVHVPFGISNRPISVSG